MAISEPPRRTHGEIINEVLALNGARVADIGCGDGALVRLMTRAGARVTGIEPSAGQLARARASEPAGGEDYLQAGAQDLPLPDASFDVVVFFNSLHHVPVELHGRAMSEAARVLKTGALLYVNEPIAAGRYFELTRSVEDETEVRARAMETLRAAGEGPLFEAEREMSYLAPVHFDNVEQLLERLVAVDARRQPKVKAQEAKLRRGFEAAAERRDGAFFFDQPCRLNLLRRR